MGDTAKYYQKNRAANRRRLTQQKKYNKTKKGLALRVNANRLNRQLGTYGNGDGLDNSHTSKGRTVKEKASKNRRRNGRNGKSKYKK